MRIRPVSILASTVTLFLLNSSFVSSDTNSPRSVNLSNEIQSASIHGYSYNSSWFRQKSENGHISEQRVLTQQTRGFLNDANFQQGYIDSLGTLYDESAQAWRILGAYIDCSDDGSNDQNYERRGRLNRQERRLENQDGGDDHNSGSGSGSGDGSGDYGGNSGQCSRYLLWAAVRLYSCVQGVNEKVVLSCPFWFLFSMQMSTIKEEVSANTNFSILKPRDGTIPPVVNLEVAVV